LLRRLRRFRRVSEREFFIDNLLVRIHFIIVMIRWTGLVPWAVDFPFAVAAGAAAGGREKPPPLTGA